MIVIIIVSIVAVLGALYYIFPLISVTGMSMYPTYDNSEVIVGTRIFSRKKLKVGDVVVYDMYRVDEVHRKVIKRIARIKIENNKRYYYCLGDNADNSYDSRYYGYVPERSLVCKIIKERGNENE